MSHVRRNMNLKCRNVTAVGWKATGTSEGKTLCYAGLKEMHLKTLRGTDNKLLLGLDISYPGLDKEKPRLRLTLPETDGLLAETKLHWT